MSNRRRSRRARLKARITTVAMAVSGLLLIVLIAVLWPIALIFAPVVLLFCWLVGLELDDGMDDL